MASRRPEVLLHGFTGSPRSWDAALAVAPAGVDRVALALPGHHPDYPCAPSFEKNVDEIAARIESRGVRRCHLIGYSLGARVALGLLVAHPGLAASATLIGVNFGLESEPERAERRDRDRAWIDLLRTSGIEAFVDRWSALPLFSTQSHVDPERLAAQRTTRMSHDPSALARSLETMGLAEMPSYWDRLDAVDAQVELITGELDRTFVALATKAVSHNPRLQHRIVAGVGHNVPLESPAAVWRHPDDVV